VEADATRGIAPYVFGDGVVQSRVLIVIPAGVEEHW